MAYLGALLMLDDMIIIIVPVILHRQVSTVKYDRKISVIYLTLYLLFDKRWVSLQQAAAQPV